MPELAAKPMRVCLLVGSAETQHCGVKDYALQLARALGERGVEAEVHAPGDWRLRSVLELRRQLRAGRFDVLHVQYPSIGFRYSLAPFLAGWAGVAPRTCLTLHEASRLPRVQRLATQLFRVTADRIVFTTAEERALFGAEQSATEVIPIASNVPVAAPAERSCETVVYFGQIRPDKGLEAFLQLAAMAPEPYRFCVLGACMPKHGAYCEALQRLASANVEWRLGATLDEVAHELASALAVYLPFPDGVSFRRGSLLAAMVNGCPVIAPCSDTTPESLRRAVLAAPTPEAALVQMDRLRGSDGAAREASAVSRALGAQFSWATVALAHQQMYTALCAPAHTRVSALPLATMPALKVTKEKR